MVRRLAIPSSKQHVDTIALPYPQFGVQDPQKIGRGGRLRLSKNRYCSSILMHRPIRRRDQITNDSDRKAVNGMLAFPVKFKKRPSSENG